jgi:hypothetical protein
MLEPRDYRDVPFDGIMREESGFLDHPANGPA